MQVRIRYYYDQYWEQQNARYRDARSGPCQAILEWQDSAALNVNFLSPPGPNGPGVYTISCSRMTFEEARNEVIYQFRLLPPTEQLDIEPLPLENTNDEHDYHSEETLPRL